MPGVCAERPNDFPCTAFIHCFMIYERNTTAAGTKSIDIRQECCEAFSIDDGRPPFLGSLIERVRTVWSNFTHLFISQLNIPCVPFFLAFFLQRILMKWRCRFAESSIRDHPMKNDMKEVNVKFSICDFYQIFYHGKSRNVGRLMNVAGIRDFPTENFAP